MARAVAARRLTQEHKISQARLADATSQAVIERLAKLLDPKNIDGTRGRWLAEATAIVHAASEASASETEHYLELYAEKEGSPLRIVLDRPTPAAIARSLNVSGPITFKSAIKKAQKRPAPWLSRAPGREALPSAPCEIQADAQ